MMPTSVRVLLVVGSALVAAASILWALRPERDTDADRPHRLPNDNACDLGMVYDREATRQIAPGYAPQHLHDVTRPISKDGRRRREDRDRLAAVNGPFMAGLPYGQLPAVGAATPATAQPPPLALPAAPEPTGAESPGTSAAEPVADGSADREPTVPMVVEHRAECAHLNRRNFDPPGGRS